MVRRSTKEAAEPPKINTIVRHLRKELGLNKVQLAKAVGCSDKTIRNVETRRWVADSTGADVTAALNRMIRKYVETGRWTWGEVVLATEDLFEEHHRDDKLRALASAADRKTVLLALVKRNE